MCCDICLYMGRTQYYDGIGKRLCDDCADNNFVDEYDEDEE